MNKRHAPGCRPNGSLPNARWNRCRSAIARCKTRDEVSQTTAMNGRIVEVCAVGGPSRMLLWLRALHQWLSALYYQQPTCDARSFPEQLPQRAYYALRNEVTKGLLSRKPRPKNFRPSFLASDLLGFLSLIGHNHPLAILLFYPFLPPISSISRRFKDFLLV